MLPKPTEEDIENMSKLITGREIEYVISPKKSSESNGFTGVHYISKK